MRRVLAVIGVGAVLAFAGCGGDDEEQAPSGRSGGGVAAGQDAPETAGSGTQEEGTAEKGSGGPATADGKQAFASTCGGCHTLEAAGTNGEVGPNLDELKPDKKRVLDAIAQGPGAMPDNLLRGAEAEAVAEYVASAAGGS